MVIGKFKLGDSGWYGAAEICQSLDDFNIVCSSEEYWLCDRRKSIAGPFKTFEKALEYYNNLPGND